MRRRVFITGLGTVSGSGLGIDPLWEGVVAGRSAIKAIESFDATGFDSRIGAEVGDFSIRDFVPKSYRKATKVMARDIELAVAAADLAARDAGLNTKATVEGDTPTYEGERVACHIGAGLIAAEIDELTAALAESRIEEGDGSGDFDINKWGREGMGHLTPLWLLKYLPNMLACHVTILHDLRGPSNTITCGEASSGLSIGESLRAISRGSADAGFCGGAESKINPMAWLRQQFTGRLVSSHGEGDGAAAGAVRPLDEAAAGTAIGEGGGILVLEAEDALRSRRGESYCEVAGFAAAQSVNREKRNLEPEPDGRGIAVAMRNALRDAGVTPEEVDLVVAHGTGVPAFDGAEAAALRTIFGERLADVPVVSIKPLIGNVGAGAGALDVAVAARALRDGVVPPVVNRDAPLHGLGSTSPARTGATLRHALVLAAGYGGQNTAIVLRHLH